MAPQSPQRPDVDACLRAAGGPFGEVGHLAPTVRALVAWIRHLEDALAKYGSHNIDCTYSEESYNDGPWPCSCGLAQVAPTQSEKEK